MNVEILKEMSNKISNIECAKVKNEITGDKAMDKIFALNSALKPLNVNVPKIAKGYGITNHITKADLENYGCDKNVMKLVKYGWIKYSVCIDVLEPAMTTNVVSFAEHLKRVIEENQAYLEDKEFA